MAINYSACYGLVLFPALGHCGSAIKWQIIIVLLIFVETTMIPVGLLKFYPRIVGCGVAIESQGFIVKLILVETTIIRMCLFFLRLTITCLYVYFLCVYTINFVVINTP